MTTATTPAAVLGPEGLLARELNGYETRPQQLAMADTVAQAIADQEHAVVEAPTGVGKSFAYLVPAAQYALRSKRKVVISTGTIALQEQLVNKDLPLLTKVLPGLKAVLVKGRQNYVSLRRLAHAASGQQALFDQRDQARALTEIQDWTETTTEGDRADLGYDPDPRVWRQVVSDSGNCMGRRCPHYDECFFYKARREIDDADLLIVNHHLYFSDLALRGENAAILPPHDVIVFDEAHSLEDVATEHLGVGISEAQVRYFLDGLWNPKGKGILADHPLGRSRDAVDEIRATNEGFWRDVTAAAIADGEDEVQRLHVPNRFPNPLSPQLDELAKELRRAAEIADDQNTGQELRAQADRCLGLAGNLRSIVEQLLEHYVYYATVPSGKGSVSLSANPLSVAELLKGQLFDETDSVILTSATLAADDSERFLFLRRRLGIDGGKAQRLDSPFDYQAQARLLVNERALDPNGPEFERSAAQWIGDFLEEATGGTFILFTSYRQLEAVHRLLAPRLERAKRFVVRQGDRMGRSQMLDLFKSVGNGVLFGTASFWEGVDVQGEALSNVIITKLPFEMPNHPLVEARHNEIKRKGGNPFMERTVPEAILRLKQGVGRLIRTKNDHGTVVILDHRVLTKAYGRYFVRALPDMPMERIRL